MFSNPLTDRLGRYLCIITLDKTHQICCLWFVLFSFIECVDLEHFSWSLFNVSSIRRLECQLVAYHNWSTRKQKETKKQLFQLFLNVPISFSIYIHRWTTSNYKLDKRDDFYFQIDNYPYLKIIIYILVWRLHNYIF